MHKHKWCVITLIKHTIRVLRERGGGEAIELGGEGTLSNFWVHFDLILDVLGPCGVLGPLGEALGSSWDQNLQVVLRRMNQCSFPATIP